MTLKKGETEEKYYFQLVFNLEQNVIKPSIGNSDKWLYFAVFTVCLVMVTSGSAFIWTSPMLPVLKSNNTSINPLKQPLNAKQQSILASIVAFGAMLGALIFGKLADIFGRKLSLLSFSTLDLIAFIALAYANNILYYYISRFVQGVVFGFAITVLPLYISEITEDRNRGKFGSFTGLSTAFGNLYGYLIGPFFSLRCYTLLCAAPLLLNIILFTIFIPESPVYLASQGNRSKAKSALKQFRDLNDRDAEKALLEIEKDLRASNSIDGGLKNFFLVPGIKKALIVSIGLNMLQQASGISAVLGFLGPIFELAELNLSGNTSAILVSSVMFLAVFVTTNLIEVLGRKTLLLISSTLTGISLFCLGFYFYLVKIDSYLGSKLSFAPFACLILFLVGFGLGLGPIPVVITSEIFLNDFKSLAASISMFCSGLIGTLAVFSFPLIIEYLGTMWCFYIFGSLCFITVVFVLVLVPETKGKSFLEIQNIFIGRWCILKK